VSRVVILSVSGAMWSGNLRFQVMLRDLSALLETDACACGNSKLINWVPVCKIEGGQNSIGGCILSLSSDC
jgi:hypothetical protein